MKITHINKAKLIKTFRALKMLPLLFFVLSVRSGLAQCNASFVYTVGTSGNATFQSTSSPTISSSTYTWSFGNGNTSNSGTLATAVANYSNNGVYTATLAYNSGTCISTATNYVIVNTAPSASCVLSGGMNILQGNNLSNTYTSAYSGTSSATTYSWNYGDGNTGNGAVASHVYSNPGTYGVILTAANVGTANCVHSMSVAATAGSVHFNSVAGTFNNYTFTSVSAPTNTNTIYSWNFGNGQTYSIVGVPTTTMGFFSNGVYVVSLQVTNPGIPFYQNSVTDTIVVTSFTNGGCNLTANFNFIQTNGGASFINTSSGTYTGTTYSWSFGDGQFSSSASPVHNYSASTIYTVTLNAYNAAFSNSCISTITKTVSICSLNFNAVALGAGQVSFTGTAVPSATNTFYYWYFGNGNISQGTNSFVTSTNYTVGGVYTVTFGISSSVPSCSLAMSQTVNSNCNVNANFIHSNGSNGLVTFTNTSTGTNTNVTYNWTFGDGSSNSNLVSPVHTYTSNGNYSVYLVANNGGGCYDSTVYGVNVSSILNCNANFTYNYNQNGSYSFSSTSTGVNAQTHYTWNFGNGATFTTTGFSNASYNYPTPGVYSVTLTITNFSTNCNSSSVQNITLTGTPCNLNAMFNSTQTGTTSFSFSNFSTGTFSGTTYTWSYGDGSYSNSFNGAHTYTVPGIYNVVLVTNNNTWPYCSSADSLTINTNNYCSMFANFSHTVGSGGNVNFNSTSTLTNALSPAYYWNFGDGVYANFSSTNHTYVNAGTYLVTLHVMDIAHVYCHDSVAQYVNVTGIPCIANSNFTLTPMSIPNYWLAIPNYPWNVSAASWDWGDGSTTDSLYTSHQYSASGTYSICLSVTVSCGSSSSYCFTQAVPKGTSGDSILFVNVMAPALSLGLFDTQTSSIACQIYPNPSSGEFNIKLSGLREEKISISVYDVIGSLIHSEECVTENGNLNKKMNLNGHNRGIYFVTLRSGNKSLTKKLVID